MGICYEVWFVDDTDVKRLPDSEAGLCLRMEMCNRCF